MFISATHHQVPVSNKNWVCCSYVLSWMSWFAWRRLYRLTSLCLQYLGLWSICPWWIQFLHTFLTIGLCLSNCSVYIEACSCLAGPHYSSDCCWAGCLNLQIFWKDCSTLGNKTWVSTTHQNQVVFSYPCCKVVIVGQLNSKTGFYRGKQGLLEHSVFTW